MSDQIHFYNIGFSPELNHALAEALTCYLRERSAHSQLDRIEKEILHMRAELQQYIADTKAVYTAFSTALDNIQGDLGTLNTKIAALEAAQANAGELTPEEIAAMNDLKTTATGLADRVSAIAAETPEPPTPPTA